jgi:hypothetical protein
LASSPGWPQTLDSPTSASWVLGLQEWIKNFFDSIN